MGTENRNRQSQDNHQRKINKYHIPKTGDGGKREKETEHKATNRENEKDRKERD